MRIALALLIACSSERGAPAPPVPPAPPAPPPIVAIVVDAAPPIDAHVDVLAELRTRGYGAAADEIEQRVAQPKPKMKLTAEQGLAAATALLEIDRAAFR